MKRFILFGALIVAFLGTYAQENLKDSITAILDNLMENPYDQCYKAANLANSAPTFEEQEALAKYAIDYVEKNVKDEPAKIATQATFYSLLGVIAVRQGDGETQYQYHSRAVELIAQTTDTLRQGVIYDKYGFILYQRGEVEKSFEYMHKVIDLFRGKGTRDDLISASYYKIAWYFYELNDSASLRKVLDDMNEDLKNTENPTAMYHQSSNMSFYYTMLAVYNYDHDKDLYRSYMDSVIYYDRKCIAVQEKYIDELSNNIARPHVYYKIAYTMAEVCDYSNPAQVDSILFYLEKSELATTSNMSLLDIIRTQATTDQLRAHIYFGAKEYDKAEKEGMKVLSALESLDQKVWVMNYHEIYQFFVSLYKTTGRFEEATKYYELLRENDKIRYDSDKINSLNEMRTKYEVEKKEAHIEYLELENETARKINLLIFSLLVILIVAIVFIVISNRLRKKNLQQSIYETALLNELKQTELEKTEEEKQLLQQEYDKLSELAGESKKQAEEFAEQLQSVKQQLEQKPTQSMAQKIQDMVSKSLIDNYHKKEYLEKLSNLDIDMLEQGYLTSDEKVTNMDMKYIICFAADMEVKDIGLIFNVEPASVYTVRYRIKKKFQGKNTFKFLI